MALTRAASPAMLAPAAMIVAMLPGIPSAYALRGSAITGSKMCSTPLASRVAHVRALRVGTPVATASRLAASQESNKQSKGNWRQPVPLTILSGFLGSGKTTMLTHILNNKEDVRIGVLVNDVAAVNIDAKLVQRGDEGGSEADSTAGSELNAWGDDLVQLSNGCACCSAGDDLFASLAELVSLSLSRGMPYDHIVVESSGVAEPRLLRAMFQEAVANDWPLMRVVSLQNMVTVVDSASFLELYESDALVRDRPDLGGGAPDESASPFVTEQPDTGDAGVVQLLVEQAEIADVVVLNKADLMSDDEMTRVEQIISAINGFATVLRAEYSTVPLSQLLVQSRELGVAGSNEVMDHKSAVDFAKWLRAEHSSPGAQEHAQADEREQPGCTDPSHDHSHAAAAAPADACAEPACTDPSHGHSHGHAHTHSHAEAAVTSADPTFTDFAHGHSHSHAEAACSDAEAACSDAACDDPTHDHSHDNRQETTAAARFGIRTFVYSRRQPFDAAKLAAVISSLPFTSTLPASLAGYKSAEEDAPAKSGSPFASLVRSKGFVWLSDEPAVAFYWSHAGKRLDVSEMGRWWASIERERWPSLHEDAILEDFDGPNGDKRQELVFIGTSLQEAEISAALDACLVEA